MQPIVLQKEEVEEEGNKEQKERANLQSSLNASQEEEENEGKKSNKELLIKEELLQYDNRSKSINLSQGNPFMDQQQQEEKEINQESQSQPKEDHLESKELKTEANESEIGKPISQPEISKPTISKSQKDISLYTDNNSTKPQNLVNINENNENGLSSSQLDSSLISIAVIKEKYRAINEAKFALETKVEIITHEALSYQKEIASLKSSLNQLKQPSSQSSEEMLKLDLIKAKQLLKSHETEKDALLKEQSKLKSQLKTYEDNLASMIEDNKLFRFETEKRFAMYQKEIDHLRMQLSTRQTQATPFPLTTPMSQKCPTSMDKLLKMNDTEEKIHNEPFDNGIPEQNLLGVNDNINMNGNIYDETKNEMIYDTSSNRGIIYHNDEEQFNFQQEALIDHNNSNEEQEAPVNVSDNKNLNNINHDDNDNDNDRDNWDINKGNNSKEININDINDDINLKNDDEFEIINANDFKDKSPEKEKEKEKEKIKEEVKSPKKEITSQAQAQAQTQQTQTQSLIEDAQMDSKQKFQKNINDLFGDSDEENESIFSTNKNNAFNVPKQANDKTKQPQQILPVSSDTKPKLQIAQQKTTASVRPQQPPPKKQETKPKVTAVTNLFNDLENDVDDEIFNKQDGESIFGKSVGNSLFD